jgi:RimJ/RimL family protein N-acetyltransferase
MTTNSLGQPIGSPVPGWQGAKRPAAEPMSGRYCRLEPLNPTRHAAELYEAFAADTTGANWTYLPYGPFASLDNYRHWLESTGGGTDPLFFAIINQRSGKAIGVASYLRIMPEAGSIEVGHLCFSPALQRTPLATEAMWLMMTNAFALGFRRYEWKCNALNMPSRRAAQRLGLSFEGVFRQAAVVKGHNRDTAWYAAIDSEWPALDAAFRCWLVADNFAADGQQRVTLTSLTERILVSKG